MQLWHRWNIGPWPVFELQYCFIYFNGSIGIGIEKIIAVFMSGKITGFLRRGKF